MKNIFNEIEAKQLINWYKQNKRELPWRDTNNPYDVWLSEIMLQQTRIEAVRLKFIQFKEALPTITSLASVDDEKLMRLWEGLGYYSRATNLKKCAKVLVDQYNGELPKTYQELVSLPGIGPYTAGAIASICFHEKVSAVDGNVLRVFSRFYASYDDVKDKRTKDRYTDEIIRILQFESIDSALFNQAIMELGEVICLPNGTPKCESCPLQNTCEAKRQNITTEIPYRSKLKQRKIIDRTIVIIRDGDKFLIHKRPSKGLLANLYEFIGFDEALDQKEIIQQLENIGIFANQIKVLPDAKHIFTHLEWHMKAYEVMVSQIEEMQIDDCMIVSKEELNHVAIPSAFKAYINWYDLRK